LYTGDNFDAEEYVFDMYGDYAALKGDFMNDAISSIRVEGSIKATVFVHCPDDVPPGFFTVRGQEEFCLQAGGESAILTEGSYNGGDLGIPINTMSYLRIEEDTIAEANHGDPIMYMGSGTCGPMYSHIKSAEECEAAAEKIHVPHKKFLQNRYSTAPHGCFYKASNKRLYFNRGGVEAKFESEQRSICKWDPRLRTSCAYDFFDISHPFDDSGAHAGDMGRYKKTSMMQGGYPVFMKTDKELYLYWNAVESKWLIGDGTFQYRRSKYGSRTYGRCPDDVSSWLEYQDEEWVDIDLQVEADDGAFHTSE